MHALAPLIYDLTLMLGIAGIVVLLFQRIHQPVVLGYLVAGVILGPYTPPYLLIKDIANIKILSELGVIFLMFYLGLEFSFQKLTRVGFSASVIGLIEVLLMFAIGYVTGILLGWSYYDSLFLGAALSISSTTIIIKAIDELKLKTRRFAELIFGVLIVEDLLAILLLAALSTLVATHNILSYDMAYAVFRLILVVGGWFLVGYFLVPPLFRSIASYLSEETLTIISVALCLTLVCVAAYFHYSTALGAFIMGSILAETTLVKRIEHVIMPIRDIFAAVFFISVGMLINPLVIVENWPAVLLIASITIVGKIITTSIGAILTGQSINTSVRVGFSMAQVGEFSFIIVALGLSLKVIDEKIYPLVVAVSGITTFTTPYLIRLSGYLCKKLDKHMPDRLRYFLDSYSAWVYRNQTTNVSNPLLRRVSVRLVINGILVAIIFALSHHLILSGLISITGKSWFTNIIYLSIVLAIASPFIWGMLFSYKRISLSTYANTKLNPAVFMIWLITLAEVTLLSILYFRSWIIVALFILIALVFFILSYKQLENSYHWFEEQLLGNIKSQTELNNYETLAPWDTYLVEIDVGEKSILNGKSLGKLHIREEYGVNVVAICRRLHVIAAPRGKEKIMAEDRLVVLGNDEQLEAFRKKMLREETKEISSVLDKFTLKGILLSKGNKLIGKSIRDSGLREKVNGLVVGLERNNVRTLNPNPHIVLEQDDLLLIVGETQKMNKLH